MTVLQNNTSFMDEKLFTVKEPMSALTHLIGAVCSIFAMPVLLIHASLYHATKLDLIAYMIFMISMILLYSASTVYHSCLLYTSPSPRDRQKSRMPSSA